MNFVTNTIATITNRVQKDESGQGALEFAFAAIILLAITFGIIDFSRAIYANSSVQAASQEAARAVIVNNDATTAAHARMVGLDANSAVIVVNNSADMVEVTVSYEFQFVTPLIGSLIGNGDGTLELTSVSSMIS